MSSLVEVEPGPGPIGEPLPIEQSEPRREVNVLQLAWRSRWLILLCMILGGGAGWAVLQRVVPLNTSRSRVYVERNLPQILSNQVQLGQGTSYLYTQAELIRSTGVLATAAESKQLTNLKSFSGVDNRVGLLKQCIKVSVGNQDDIINVSAELPDG